MIVTLAYKIHTISVTPIMGQRLKKEKKMDNKRKVDNTCVLFRRISK